ncbi:hypothetical protein M409DRAFT_30710 [Zasmidium cellare ATCC 36951]|uniref:SnoaL-like domain-containing protein n=1 Tax=Zasmidium cellare ATCC 36951 TaxID=1080233 RepID=A0A6A6BXQ1_ZASCE|nr:uncharacterized protein M409DRAFT_30710 [Zasmidium cellare ATCC 36951]KAF2158838.1 hypothetical protein M409DRAFT_30710 [Zasmidium cellare ATCC 36951]
MSSSRYPSPDEIQALFNNMASGNYDAFYARVSPNVDWTVLGTHPCAGRYKTLKDFQDGTLTRLGKIMKKPGLNLAVRNVIGGGDAEWAMVELVANAECFKFDNCYAWCVRFDQSGTIVEVRAYLDSWMVRQAIIENETPSHRAPVPDVSKF